MCLNNEGRNDCYQAKWWLLNIIFREKENASFNLLVWYWDLPLTCLKVSQFSSHWLMSQLLFYFSLHQRTPLHFAAREGHEKTVKFLIVKRAQINIQDIDGVGIWDYTTDGRFLLKFELAPCAPRVPQMNWSKQVPHLSANICGLLYLLVSLSISGLL